MSFIITVYTNEGIVMASDSRTTYTKTIKNPGGLVETQIGVQITDTTNKTFLCPGNIGISTCGESSIGNKPIAGFIEEYIATQMSENDTVEAVSEGLLLHFGEISPDLDTKFIVAGYDMKKLKQQVYRILIKNRKKEVIDTFNAGATWSGETDTLIKLINPVALKVDNNTYQDLIRYEIGFNYFTLQDAINFAEYAVDVTIKTMFFQNRVKTVGGPIDILVIKPTGAFWVKHKELHA